MLKIRIIPTLLHKGYGLVKGERFDSWRGVGAAMQAIKVYAMREVDELIFVDIGATPEGRGPDFDLIDELADECFMPLTVGGGVRSLDDVKRLLRVGADKVAIGSASIDERLVCGAADRFGAQCVIASIDVRRQGDRCEVFTCCGTRATGLDPLRHAEQLQRWGAGEILLTAIDRDGMLNGYDIDLITKISAAVDIPVIAAGGAGSYAHFADGIRAGASAVAAGAMYHFTQQTPAEAKLHLAELGFSMRLPTKDRMGSSK